MLQFKPVAFLGALFCFAAVIRADGVPPPQGDSPARRPSPVIERVEVRLAQVDVVVRDAKGRIVSGLGPGDFSVVEDGVALEVVGVDEWGAEAARPSASIVAKPQGPASQNPSEPTAKETKENEEAERRSFVIAFDALGDSTALRMNQARTAATRFVRSHLGPRDLAAVYQVDLSLRPVSGVTSDAEEIARGIGKIAWMPASSLADQINESVLSGAMSSEKDFLQERLTGQALTAGAALDWQREHTYDLLKELTSVFAGLPGKRVLVLISPGFPLTTAPDVRRATGGFTPRFRDLIRALASVGVTVYTLDIGNDLAAGDAAEPIDWRAAVGKLGMDENVLSDLGLERALGTASASSRREFLGVIAAESGGRMLTSTDLNKAFEAIQEESSHFYRISCRMPVSRDLNRYRRFTVKVRREGASVTGRKGRYSDITPMDRVVSSSQPSVDSVDRYRQLAMRGVATPLAAANAKTTPVDVVMEVLGPIEIATDASGAGSIDLDIRLVARVADEVVTRYERSLTAKVKPEGVGPVKQAFRVEGRLDLLPGIYDLQGTVRLASPPQMATWSGQVLVPPHSPNPPPSIRGPYLIDAESPTPLLHHPAVDEASDPFTVGSGHRVLPMVSTSVDAGRNVLTMFWLDGFPAEAGKPPDATLSVRVRDAAGHEVEAPAQLVLFTADPAGGYRAMSRVETSKLPAGAYVLTVGAASADKIAPRRSVPFSIAVTSSSSSGSP